MEFIVTPAELAELQQNARRSVDQPGYDPVPVVAFRAPDGPQIWLLTEIADDGDTAYGLCDVGVGCPEPGEVSLAWLASLRGPLGLAVERLHGIPSINGMRLSQLARVAHVIGRIML